MKNPKTGTGRRSKKPACTYVYPFGFRSRVVQLHLVGGRLHLPRLNQRLTQLIEKKLADQKGKLEKRHNAIQKAKPAAATSQRGAAMRKPPSKSDSARPRAELIMKVRCGIMSAREASTRLCVSRKTYYKWEERGLSALLDGVADQTAVRP